jgi:demethylmenaquinone methyltransferase/2-methoxy-6-polyprenyl-1,4-benzoquinol methylase
VRDRFRARFEGRGRGNPVPTEDIGALFDRIADRYDAMNLVISAFQEPRWRRRLVQATELEAGMAAIDVATGTGKVAASLADRVGTFGHVLGVDVSDRMVARAQSEHADRIEMEFVIADALDLPVDDGTFDAATIAFGMRNLPDYRRGFEEMLRAVRPGGRVVCLEISRPRSVIGRLGRIWFERIVPRLGSLIGQGRAYAYLVESVRGYPTPEEIAAVMRDAGLVDVAWTSLTFGMVTLHVGVRPTGPPPEATGLPREAPG